MGNFVGKNFSRINVSLRQSDPAQQVCVARVGKAAIEERGATIKMG